MEDLLHEITRLESQLATCIENCEGAHGLDCPHEHISGGRDKCNPFVDSNRTETGDRSLNTHQLKIQEHVEFGFKRRSKKYIQDVFTNHCEGNVISKKKFRKALQDLKIELDDNDMEELFRRVDVDRNESLSLSEFESIVTQPSELERWALSIPFHFLLADAILCIEKEGAHALEKASNLSESDIQILCHSILDGMMKMVSGKISELKQAFDRMHAAKLADAGPKFLTVSSMSCGSTQDFHRGLEGLIGTPHLKFLEAMKAEHCNKSGYNHQIVTPNYKIKTCPEMEWNLIIKREGKTVEEYKEILSKEFPSVGLGPDHHGRRIPDLNELLQLEESRQAKLIKCEVLAIVLYTGPLYLIYNAILRRWPKDLYDIFHDGSNLFTTTIHVLVSAVQKLSRSLRIPDGMKLYRGLGGTMDLPERFYNADEQGCKGFAEWGFMSTTANRDVAIHYSGVLDGKPKCLVLELRVGAVDRGACLQKFSQYQGEEEYLYMPLSFLQQDRDIYTEVTASGVVSIIPVRIIPNLKTQTVEEALEKTKSLHISAFAYQLDELQREISEVMSSDQAMERLRVSRALGAARQDVMSDWDRVTPSSIVKSVMSRCRAVLSRHEGHEPVDFTDVGVHRALTVEMVSTKTFAISTLRCAMESWGDWRDFVKDNLDLLFFHRHYLGHLKHTVQESPPGSERRRETALKICKIRGLVTTTVDAVNHCGESPLAVAVHDGAGLDLLDTLVEAGADPSKAIDACCFQGNLEALSLLIRRGADVASTSITTAAGGGQVECVRMLVGAKASVDGVGKYDIPVYSAADCGQVECVRALVEMKANVNRTDPWGWTPLMTVTRRNNTEDRRDRNTAIAQILRAHGAR